MDAAFLLQAGQGASSLATPAWLDVFAVGFGSFTIGVVLTERRTTLVGTLFAGILVGIGGGVIRDLLLGLRPIATETHWYVSTGAVCALAGVVFAHYIPVDAWFVLLLNTCFMALFCVIGANKALVYQSPWPVAIMLGVVTGTGGGILLDLVQGEPPIIFGRDSEWAAPAALIGTTLYVALALFLPGPAAAWIGGIAVVVLRMAGAVWKWPDPTVLVVTLPSRFRDSDAPTVGDG